MAKTRWTPELEEKLYLIASNYYESLQAHDSYTESSVCIKQISEELAVDWATPSSVLYRLADQKFLKTLRHSRKDQIFYRQASSYTIQNFKICPKFQKIERKDVDEIISTFLELIAKHAFDVTAVCGSISQRCELVPLHIQKILFENGLIEIDSPPRRLKVKQDYIITSSEKDGDWNTKQAPSELKARINTKRAELGVYYNPSSHSLPAVIRSSDGTGFGKSYSVFNEYINNSLNEPDIKHRNFVFITPQKSQIDIAEELLKSASTNGLPVLPVLAIDDIRSLDFSDWIDGVTNEERYQDWIAQGKKAPYMKVGLTKLEQLIYQIRRCEQASKYSQSPQERSLFEQQVISLKYDVDKTIYELALDILNRVDDPINFEELIEKAQSSSLYKLRLDIVSRVFPFQRALIEPCVLVFTTAKFERTTFILKTKRNGLYIKEAKNFDELIGGSKRPALGLVVDTGGSSAVNPSAYVATDHVKQIEYLQDIYFAEDSTNPFVQSNIAFTLVIDEEHESYERLRKGGTTKLITPDTNFPHTLSGLCRAYKAILVSESGELYKPPLYKELRKFFTDIESALSMCQLSANQTMQSLLELFQSNIGHIQIDRSDAEQILNITRNLFNFAPKHFFNEQALKRIKIVSLQNHTFCKLYFAKEDEGQANLHDVYQLAMAILDAASQISNPDIQTMLGNEVGWSQNSPLSNFISLARSNRDSIKYLFERAQHANQEVDHHFTYFQPKTIFSLRPRQNTEFRDPKLKEFIYVDFTLSLLRELPEVTLIRTLRRDKNAAYLLSATTGFHKIFNGNFNYDMLRLYGEYGTTNLGFQVNEREKSDLPMLQGLRDAREKLRDININSFDAVSKWITSEPEDKDFLDAVRNWEERLNPNSYIMSSKYRKREFRRTLHSILLAAFDGKSSLVLTLSKNFFRILSNYVIESNGSCRKLFPYQDIDKTIYTFKPFDNGNVIRLVCFDARLAKTTDVAKHTYLAPNETLVMVAAYQSAGTGLNFFVRYIGTKFKEDFTRLILVNSPYFSEVRNSQDGLNTLDNWLTLLKFYADGDERKYLADFDVNLVNGENYGVLEREHQMSIFKKVMQAIGRVEREDTLIQTEIHIPSDLMAWAILHFSRLNNQTGNEILLGSMSLLNTALMNKCLTLAEQSSFSSIAKREAFESKVYKDNGAINKFCATTVIEDIQACRGGNEYPSLNETLRNIESVRKPARWIESLKQTERVRENEYAKATIDSFFIHRQQDNRTIQFCRTERSGVLLTDLSDGSLLYQPEYFVFPPYIAQHKNQKDVFWKKYSEISSLRDEAFVDYIPHPAIIPVLKGNVGEYLLDAALEQLGIPPLSTEEFLKTVPMAREIYEYFDRYVELHGQLFCIDAKNWSSTFDQKEKSIETMVKAKSKTASVKRLLGNIYQDIHFIYVNTRYDQNPLNLMAEYDGNNTYYLNLLQNQYYYSDGDPQKQGMVSSEEVTLNPTFFKLFQ